MVCRNIKQSCIVDPTMEVDYVVVYEAPKEAVFLYKFLGDVDVILDMKKPPTLYYDNSEELANSKEPISYKRGKHIERKYHLIRDIVKMGDVLITK